MAYRLVGLIVAWMPSRMYPPDVAVGVNLPVLLFSAGLALFTVVLFGLAACIADGEAGYQAGHAVQRKEICRKRAP